MYNARNSAHLDSANLHRFLSNRSYVAQSNYGPPYLGAFSRARSAPSDWDSSWCTRSPGTPPRSWRHAGTPRPAETTNGKRRVALVLPLSHSKRNGIEFRFNSPDVLTIVPDFPARTPSRFSPRPWTRSAASVCWSRCSISTVGAVVSSSLRDPPINYLAGTGYARRWTREKTTPWTRPACSAFAWWRETRASVDSEGGTRNAELTWCRQPGSSRSPIALEKK